MSSEKLFSNYAIVTLRFLKPVKSYVGKYNMVVLFSFNNIGVYLKMNILMLIFVKKV